jgi:peptidoglycan/xylan/chitin deacetylase (PgdA/CDA1 family)
MSAKLQVVLLRAVRALGLFRLARHLTGRSLVILGYHGFELAEGQGYKHYLFMSERIFTDRLEYIRKTGLPVLPLGKAVELLDEDRLPKNSLCITIDDGFYGAYTVASKVLTRFQFPATVYITTYYMQKENPVFRLVVQYMFARTRVNTLKIENRSWARDQVVDLRDPRMSKRVMTEILHHGMEDCDEEGREQISLELGQLLGIDYQWIKETRVLSMINPTEIRELVGKGMDMQLHTHRHRFPQDDEEAARKEIRENREILEPIVGRPADHFCYPNGLWAKHQWAWLRDLGIRSAVTCQPGVNRQGTPPLALKRFVDSESVSQVRFEAEVCGFLDIMRRIRQAFSRER